MELRTTRQMRRNEQLDKVLSKKAESPSTPAKTQTQPAPRQASDRCTLSRQALQYLDRYRAHCITLGRRVSFDGEGTLQTGTVTGVNGDFALQVAGDDGKEHIVSSGTVKMI